MHHYHAYSWTGAAKEREQEYLRKPPLPPTDPGEFVRSPLPPMRTCDWLLKSRERCLQTLTDTGSAVKWMAGMWDQTERSLADIEGVARAVGRDSYLATAEDLLPRRIDVQWGFWLRGERFITIGVVCCPNIHAPDYRCPASPRG